MDMEKQEYLEKKQENYLPETLGGSFRNRRICTGKIHNRSQRRLSPAVEVEVGKAFLPGSLVDVRPLKRKLLISKTRHKSLK